MTKSEQQWESWLATRPPVVQQMARRFPPGTKLILHGRVMWVVAYNESGGLSVTAIDPAEDYDAAVAQRQPVCQCCVGKLEALRV